MELRRRIFSTVVIAVYCLVQQVSPVPQCSGRTVLTELSGTITDGDGDYTKESHCEWLIKADSSKFINLEFRQFDTECSYDYLFIYDGQSYSDKLLGSYSGNTLPDKLVATSGYALIFLFSDRNSVREGFRVDYSITNCPHDCNGKTCLNGKCILCSDHIGDACDYQLHCNGHGSLNIDHCQCEGEYRGYNCELLIGSNIEGHSEWYNVSVISELFTPRAGHAGVWSAILGRMYVFGGYNLQDTLDDLLYYDLNTTNQWRRITQLAPRPSGRYEHTMSSYGDKLFIYGGVLANGDITDELWSYDITTNDWTKFIPSVNSTRPPALAGHTMTLVDDWLYLFGGRKSDWSFSSEIYRINVSLAGEWERVNSKGGKEEDRRLVGHSTVYHAESRSLIVYGGHSVLFARFSQRISNMHAFHVDEHTWSEIHGGSAVYVYPPGNIASHSAVIMGNYMVVYGGVSSDYMPSKNTYEEVCQTARMYVYHLGCHMWVDPQHLEASYSTATTAGDPVSGRLSHVATVAYGNIMLVVGGYRGNVLGDVIAYKAPPNLAVHQDTLASGQRVTQCDHYSTRIDTNFCTSDPECVWCSERIFPSTAGCLHRTQTDKCANGLRYSECPGICSALHDCLSCVHQGRGVSSTTLTGTHQKEQCSWCVKASQCQPTAAPSGFCASGSPGWWGSLSASINTTSQCRTENKPAGMVWAKYSYPQNYNRPDEVNIAEKMDGTLLKPGDFKNQAVNERFVASFLGFIHPLNAKPTDPTSPLRVTAVSIYTESRVWMSTDDNPINKEYIVYSNLLQSSYTSLSAERAGGNMQVFPNSSVGYRYYTNHTGFLVVKSGSVVQAKMLLQWNANIPSSGSARPTFSAEYLEPYNSGQCDQYDNCMGCMLDVSCGWCPLSRLCVQRSNTSVSADQCGSTDPDHQLIVNATHCSVCSDIITCDDCAKNIECGWKASDVKCEALGRHPDLISNVSMCPSPCFNRSSCSECVTHECAWCDNTQECFPFSSYVSSQFMGQCLRWVDSYDPSRCHNCSQHTNCKTCLNDYRCGWCGNEVNPTIGQCLDGDFTGPSSSSNCSALIAQVHNITTNESADWSYGLCPDVQECLLGLDDCHGNATCTNTFESFECTCNRGFKGDGRQSCEETCYHDCVNGVCSSDKPYRCQCFNGWTSDNCTVDCGCNFHSFCHSGKCDFCYHNTMGEFCQLCKPGAYGNATDPKGCDLCECNGHSIAADGHCNSTTGQCYCTDHTTGHNCEKCEEGYYGNPTNNGKCYQKCEGRSILTSITSDALGSHEGKGLEDKGHAHCIWILTVYDNIENPPTWAVVPTISFTVEQDIVVDCTKAYVYVYDGIPKELGSQGNSKLLGAFCGDGLAEASTVVASSGFLTVYYEANIVDGSYSKGFNALYHINKCPNDCAGNRHCVANECVCQPGYGGIDCSVEFCPNNCSDHGTCDMSDKMQCVCSPGYAGEGCNVTIAANDAIYWLLNDPQRTAGDRVNNDTFGRMGHTMVSCDDVNFYMMYGFSFTNGIMGDMWKYNVDTDAWTLITPSGDNKPLGRYHHAAVCVPNLNSIYMFGGIMADSSGKMNAVNKMWRFNIDTGRWTAISLSYNVPALAAHTLTLVDDKTIVLVGGFSSAYYFGNATYLYDTSDNTWRQLAIKGTMPTGVYGHTTIYHQPSNALYVYGGYYFVLDKFLQSNKLYALDLDTSSYMWHRLAPENTYTPVSRMFHAAVGTQDYMLVIGGSTGQYDYSASVMAYIYDCNMWMNVTIGLDNVIGNSIPAVIGHVAFKSKNSSYIFGGFNGISYATQTKLTLPDDLCTLIEDSTVCAQTVGCSSCVVTNSNPPSTAVYCYSIKNGPPGGCRNSTNTTSLVITNGVACNAQLMESRDCSQHKSCAECVTVWPIYKNANKACQWCSNCQVGGCISASQSCLLAHPCGSRTPIAYTEPDACWERKCVASDCDKCRNLNECFWTRNAKRTDEIIRTLSRDPVYNWNCLGQNILALTSKITIPAIPPDKCLSRCYQFNTCSACLTSNGSEGGANNCVWSDQIGECMPPAYLPLRCSSGDCGYIVEDSSARCPQKCSVHAQCSHCLASPGCGWCALGGLNGVGVCMEGGLGGPTDGVCSALDISLGSEPLPGAVANVTSQATGPPSWSLFSCPAEDECLNDHHTCHDNENCVDTVTAFDCVCKTGYKRDISSGLCKPECTQGCLNGLCTQPNVCDCNFGWVGSNCSVECLCNKHSNCFSDTKLDSCIECLNNTQGPQCQECKPMFVGIPLNGGACVPCSTHCKTHSDICITPGEKSLLDQLGKNITTGLTANNIISLLTITKGPTGNAQCVDCQDNTEDATCGTCQDGFFRLSTELETTACQPCKCNGHSATCNKVSGIGCNCHNHTETKCSSSSNEQTPPCYESQCATCNEYFIGTPTDGHQCFRKMSVDTDYCFDPDSQTTCDQELPLGRTVFFAIQPKYLNVDIRSTIDVAYGGVDVYFSPNEDTFKVTQNHLTLQHQVAVDPKYLNKRRRRSTNATVYELQHKHAVDGLLTTFVTVKDPQHFFVVHNVTYRLVITLPEQAHTLKTAKFYLVLKGVGNASNSSSKGSMFFRQDQPHIDLFVFFSVFFSCFFLFLAVCVLVWKFKQRLDLRRSRHQRQLEMKHMASRPFANVLVIIDQDMCPLISPTSGLRRRPSRSKMSNKMHMVQNTENTNSSENKHSINPVTIEPTDDGIAAVGTVMFQMPGGITSPAHACLGSALMTLRVMYPHLHHSQKTATIRRRTSVNT